jgi:apolipoprotein D and lipocalin family protein
MRSPRPRPTLGPLAVLAALLAAGCTSMPPIKTVERLDLPRFMGDWYVIAAIPAAQEANAFNGVESYRLRPGTTDVVEVTYTFREGAFDGPLVTLQPVGHVSSDNPAEWGMKFWWWQGPLRLEYLVAWLDADYSRTIIARSARDYVWIMARTSALPAEELDRLIGVVKGMGYDTSRMRRFPQRWDQAPGLSPSDRKAPGAG